jgi:hypothetical protein
MYINIPLQRVSSLWTNWILNSQSCTSLSCNSRKLVFLNSNIAARWILHPETVIFCSWYNRDSIETHFRRWEYNVEWLIWLVRSVFFLLIFIAATHFLSDDTVAITFSVPRQQNRRHSSWILVQTASSTWQRTQNWILKLAKDVSNLQVHYAITLSAQDIIMSMASTARSTILII